MEVYKQRRFGGYIEGLAVLAVAVLVRGILDPFLGDSLSHPTIFAAVMLAAWNFGSGPAVLIAVLGYPLIEVFVLDASAWERPTSYLAASLFLYLALNAIILAFVSALKRQAAATAAGEIRLRSAQALAHLGTWELDLRKNRLSWSDEVYHIFGLRPGEFEASYEAFLAAIHPDDRAAVDAAYMNSIREGLDTYEIEHRIVRKNGEVRTVHEKCEHERDLSGKIVRSCGMVHDITDLKRTQEEIAAVYDNAPLMLMLVDAELQIRKLNRFSEKYVLLQSNRLFSNALGDMLGCLTALEGGEGCGFRPGCGTCLVRSSILETFRTGRNQDQMEVCLRLGKDPAQEHVFLMSTCRLSVQGEPMALVTLLDVTERKQMERQLRESQARLRATFDRAGVGIMEAEGADRFVAANDRACEIFGYTHRELLEMSVPELTWQEDRSISESVNAQIHSGERDRISYEKRYRRKDGSPLWAHVTVTAVKDEEGRWIRSITTIEDMSDRKRAETELERAVLRLREADKRKDEFLAMLAHELRNPMSAISMAGTLLSMPGIPEDQAEFAKRSLKDRIHQLSRLIDDLLDVSRIATGKITLKKKQVQISAVVASAVESTKKQFEDRDQELSVEMDSSVSVFADPVRLEQAVGNLLSNASKFMGNEGRAAVLVSREGSQAVIKVKDNGTGISPELLPNVFDLFRQADTSLHRTSGGLGIGLTIAKKVAELHDGAITAKSEGPGKGSEFEIRLPASEHAAVETGSREAVEVRPGLKILIVEDHKDTALATAALLELAGHYTEVHFDGESGLEAALRLKPDVVLLDIGLPGLSGYEVARKIREGGLAHIAIIAVSGYGQMSDIEMSKDSGIDHHFLKPLDYEQLQIRLKEHQEQKLAAEREALKHSVH